VSARTRFAEQIGSRLGAQERIVGSGRSIQSLLGRGRSPRTVEDEVEDEEVVFDSTATEEFGGIVSPSRRVRTSVEGTKSKGEAVGSEAAAEELMEMVRVDAAATCGAQVGGGLGDLLKACGDPPAPGKDRLCAIGCHKDAMVTEDGCSPRDKKGNLMMAAFVPSAKADAFEEFA